MKDQIKRYFVPSANNNYHPHILHTKRTIFYSFFFSVIKVFLVGVAMFIPAEAFVLPDVLVEEQKQIVALTNKVRKEHNKKMLSVSPKLTISAQGKADDMATKNYFSHSNNRKSIGNWVEETGYDYEFAGENLAVGYSSAEDIVDAWINSPTHFSNLIDSDFKDLGVGLAGGVYDGEPTAYIAQHFATPVKVVKNNVQKNYSISQNVKELSVSGEGINENILGEKLIAVHNPVPPVISTAGSTPIDKYLKARSVLTPITKIFDFSKGMYLIAIIFFATSLIIKIFIEIRKQHPHVILQTTALIGLLLLYWKY